MGLTVPVTVPTMVQTMEVMDIHHTAMVMVVMEVATEDTEV